MMSRNTNSRRQPATPIKLKDKSRPRRDSDSSSSSLDLSDEEGYSGVDEISDDEDDDEEDVDAVEENAIMSRRTLQAPRPHPDGGEDQDRDEEEEEEEEPEEEPEEEEDDDYYDDDGNDDDQKLNLNDEDYDNKSASWNGIASDVDLSQASDFYNEANILTPGQQNERHVRFDVPFSDSDSTDTEDNHEDLFPDIFVSQNSLDPAFRREIEHDDDDSSNSGSFWDYHGTYSEHPQSKHVEEAEGVIQTLHNDDDDDDTPAAISVIRPSMLGPNLASDRDEELDGYETDGDTTEEDVPEPLIRRKIKRPSVPPSDHSDSELEVTDKPKRGQPWSGRFKLDRSDRKPIAVLNPLTRKMMIFTPNKRRQLDVSPESFNVNPWGIEDQSSPLLSNSANLMLSAMFPPNGMDMGSFAPTLGPAEAFFPFTSDAYSPEESSNGGESAGEANDDDAEQKLTFEDFIAWEEDESSGDEPEPDWEPSSTPLRPTTASSDAEVLSHLNPQTVGAFRRNQINSQLILSRQATQDSLAFSGPLNYTTIKGLKADRFDTAGMPLTPARRRKRHSNDLNKSPLDSVSMKRKASVEASGHNHKRPNSISAVNALHL